MKYEIQRTSSFVKDYKRAVKRGCDLSNQSIRENYISSSIHREIPNADTIAAMKGAEEMAAHPEKYQTFDNMDDLIKALET